MTSSKPSQSVTTITTLSSTANNFKKSFKTKGLVISTLCTKNLALSREESIKSNDFATNLEFKASAPFQVTQSLKSTEKNSTKKSFLKKKSSNKSTDKSPENKMINTVNSSSNNSMTPTAPNLSKAIVNLLLMTKKPKSSYKTLKPSSIKESKTWKSPRIPQKSPPNKFSRLKKN